MLKEVKVGVIFCHSNFFSYICKKNNEKYEYIESK